jgi:hypothetical protein
LGQIFEKPDDPSRDEAKFFKRNEEWIQKEGAYALIQSTKPQSLAAGLTDSPAGLAAWIIEKFRAWSDCGGNIESRFTKDELLTHIMIIPALLRLLKCKRDDLDEGGNQKLGRFMQSSRSVRSLSERYQSSAAGMGRAVFRCATLDRNA